MLQTRNAKRPAQAAVRFAVDAFEERLLSKAEAIATIDADTLDALLHPSFDATARFTVLARGVAASPGAAKGTIVFTAPEAVAQAAEGKSVILVRPFTEADDVAGFHAAVGILTAEGGKASHAALVARGMGRPAVTGAAALDIDLKLGEVRIDDLVLHGGDFIAIDGTNGLITTDDVPLVEAHIDARFETVLRWSDELRQIGVRANADTPEDATRAHRFGAEGIGLCRTEHMFMAADRQPKMRAMIMAHGRRRPAGGAGRAAPAPAERLRRPVRGDGRMAGDDPPARPAAARVPARPLRAARGDRACADRPQPAPARPREPVRSGPLARGDQPDARHPRRAPRRDAARDLRDAGAGDRSRRGGGARAHRPRTAPRDHDPAGGLRARARAGQEPRGVGGRGGGAHASEPTSASGR